MGTGILYAIIVLAWLAYLVPLIRSHRRESAPARSVEAFANTMRVLGKRSQANARGGAGSRVRVTGPAPRTAAREGEAVKVAESRVAEQRASRRRAASRRRVVLSLLLVATAAVAAGASMEFIAWWPVAVPAGLTFGFLVLSMLTVARQRQPARRRPDAVPATTAERTTPAGARRIDAVYPGSAARPAASRQAVAAAERSALDDAAAWVANSQLGAWEPHPVSLPAYVTAPPAPVRTVRTIDLADATVFSAGHLPEAVLLGRQPDSVEELAKAAGQGREDDDGDARVAAGA